MDLDSLYKKKIPATEKQMRWIVSEGWMPEEQVIHLSKREASDLIQQMLDEEEYY